MTDQELLSELQYALLEPADGGQSWLSEVWTRDDVVNALNESERQLLRRTHLLVKTLGLGVLNGATSVPLPPDWLATAYVVWWGLGGLRTPLAPVDITEADLGRPTWEIVFGTPQGYRDSEGATLTISLVPTPDTDGTVELVYIAAPIAVNGNGRSFTVPDDYLSGVKYGALSRLLRGVGRLQDPERAAYCDQREDLVATVAEIILGGFA